MTRTHASSATEIYTPHVFRGTRQMAIRATTSGTSTRKPGLLFGADLHGPHNKQGNVMIPVVGQAACATAPSAYAVSWGLRRDDGQRDGERRRREEEKWGEGPFYTPRNTYLPKWATDPQGRSCLSVRQSVPGYIIPFIYKAVDKPGHDCCDFDLMELQRAGNMPKFEYSRITYIYE